MTAQQYFSFAESTPDSADPRAELMERLRGQVGCVTTKPDSSVETFSTGCGDLDACLPHQGLRVDSMTEWVAADQGCGAASLSLIAVANRLADQPGPCVVVGGCHTFYPPAAIALGVPADRIIWAQPRRHADVIWAIDQALRCESVVAVWAHLGAGLDDRDARRLQLAAEMGPTPGFFVRPTAVRGRPSFADVRFHITASTPAMDPSLPNHFPGSSVPTMRSAKRRLQIAIDRCRGGCPEKSLWVQIDDQARVHRVDPYSSSNASSDSSRQPPDNNPPHETAALYLASQLAHPTTSKSRFRKQRVG